MTSKQRSTLILIGKILLSAFKWFIISLGVQMIAIMIGFSVENPEFPLGSAIAGMVCGAIVFCVGWIVDIVKYVKEYKRTRE